MTDRSHMRARHEPPAHDGSSALSGWCIGPHRFTGSGAASRIRKRRRPFGLCSKTVGLDRPGRAASSVRRDGPTSSPCHERWGENIGWWLNSARGRRRH